MNTWARKSFKVGVLSAGVLLFAGTAANADINSIGNSGFLSGNQINAAIQAPINVCGNAIGIAGNASAACVGGSWANLGSSGDMNSLGNAGIGSGNQINAALQAPMDVCGNAIGLFGNTHAACVGGAAANLGEKNRDHRNKHHHKDGNKYDDQDSHSRHVTAAHVKASKKKESAHITEGAPAGPSLNSFGNSGVGSGNQINSSIQVPIDVCGNAIGVVGNAKASCVGGSSASANGSGAPTLNSGFNSGILSGNQVNSLLQVPINVCGNAIGLFGNTQASCVGGATANAGGGNKDGRDHDGKGNNGGGGGGNDFGSMLASMGGESATTEGGKNNDDGHKRQHHKDAGACSIRMNSLGNSGFLSGNQINKNIQMPIEISGNAIGHVGNASAWSVGGAFANC